jgi:DNA-directed RNA polymerase specialized sigma54-like protein
MRLKKMSLVVLKHIQRLDPIGVGSRNLAECLKVNSISRQRVFI